jgi:hypothetical protein
MTTGTQMFLNCTLLQTIPLINLSSMTTGTQMLNNCYSLSRYSAINNKVSFSVDSCKLSKTSLQTLFSVSLFSNVTGQTITISSNYGSDISFTKPTCGTTNGSAVITQTNTTSLAVGMRVSGAGVTGTGIDTGHRAVTLQGAVDTITLANHGLPNGKLVYLMTLVTTTGISPKTPYYVVNTAVNTFQLSLTNGGSVIDLITDGTGTIFYPSFITSINTNVSFTLDVPASASGSVTLTSRILDTSLAVGKGWVVSG